MSKLIAFTLWGLCCNTIVSAQAFLNVTNPLIDNRTAFMDGRYDVDLMKKNRVATFRQENVSAYFDTSGRIVKFVLRAYDSSTQTTLFKYDSSGDCIATKMTDTKLMEPINNSQIKQYENGLLVKDSSTSGYFCRRSAYYSNGQLREELWFGMNHRLQQGFWFGVDTIGRLNRIVERRYYMNNDPPGGTLSSNRTLYYNSKGQLVSETEEIKNSDTTSKPFFAPMAARPLFPMIAPTG